MGLRRGGEALGLVIAIGSGCVINNLKFDEDTDGSTAASITSITGASVSASTGSTSTTTTSGESDAGSGSVGEVTSVGTDSTGVVTEATTTEPTTTEASTTADSATTGPPCVPGDPELCDGLDNNCNGLIDEGESLTECNGCYLSKVNGHYYYACLGPLKISEVHGKCQTYAYGGAAAYHVKVDDMSENTHLIGYIPTIGEASIGIRAHGDSPGDSTVWYYWIVDDSSAVGQYGGTDGKIPWAPGEPNLDFPVEKWVVIRSDNFGWNNTEDDAYAYFCEATPG